MSNKKIETLVQKPELTFFENEEMFRMLDFDVESTLDMKSESVEEYMRSNTGHALSEVEKDALYATAQNLYVEFKNYLREAKFNFFFNRAQYNLLTDLLLKKLEYDVNTLFIAMELNTMLKELHNTKFVTDTELVEMKLTATELTYMYHLIQNHKVKGLCKEAYTFAELLTRIGNVSKIINFYDAKAKSLVEDIQKWALRFDGSDALMGELVPSKETVSQSEETYSTVEDIQK